MNIPAFSKISRKTRIRLIGLAILLVMAGSTLTDVPLNAEIGTIRLYKKHVSPVSSHFITCRFNPTCSSYALQVLEADGFWRGNIKITFRLLRCSPFGYLWDTLLS